MSVKEWFKKTFNEKYSSFKEGWLSNFNSKCERDGFFWAIHHSIRVLLLLLFIVFLLIVGIVQFALGMSVAILLLSYWTSNFSFLGLPLGLSGECKVCLAALYAVICLLANMIQIMMAWSRNLGDRWQQENKNQNLVRRISEDGWVTKKLYVVINAEWDFFGHFYLKTHVLVFLISFIAFLIKR